ncbi:MAG: response regulator [Acetobacteraceae bacterium]|jgi:DNA-binding response OmpR family regulator
MSATNQVNEHYRSRPEGTIKPARILVVEDQELLAKVIADVLGDAHEVVCVTNVEDAVDHLLGDAIDLVLLDCVLPDGPNWQVALEADRQNIPVVFMTGDPGQAKELVGGARPYLLKPFGLATLIEVIDSTVAGEMGQWDDPAYGRRITDYYTRPAP